MPKGIQAVMKNKGGQIPNTDSHTTIVQTLFLLSILYFHVGLHMF